MKYKKINFFIDKIAFRDTIYGTFESKFKIAYPLTFNEFHPLTFALSCIKMKIRKHRIVGYRNSLLTQLIVVIQRNEKGINSLQLNKLIF